jgi:hypothetical protein
VVISCLYDDTKPLVPGVGKHSEADTKGKKIKEVRYNGIRREHYYKSGFEPPTSGTYALLFLT